MVISGERIVWPGTRRKRFTSLRYSVRIPSVFSCGGGGSAAVVTARSRPVAPLVAWTMGVGEPELTWIRRGAILHDVGKIGVSDAILRKPGKLDAAEWEEMKRHPEMGYHMLKHIRFLAPALDIVHCHQERFDGSGYPRGLRGDAIPLGARIFAAVDTFDAMTSDRPYRPGMPVDDALAELRRCAGTQFDPQVVDALCAAVAERATVLA